MSSSRDAVWVPEEEMAAAQEALGWATSSPELYLTYGMVAMKGMPPALADAVVATPSFTLLSPLLGVDYFAVLDAGRGLGAAGGAEDEPERLLTLLRDAIAGQVYLELFGGRPLFRDGTARDAVEWWTSAVREAFRTFHDEVAAGRRRHGEPGVDPPAATATAIVALVLERYLVIGNCGASKAVLCRDGELMELGSDPEHMANRGDENKSVDSAGGGGVAIKLAASGSSSAPAAVAAGVVDVVAVKREAARDEFLILGSAALWDKVTPAAACAHVRRRVGRASRITMPWETRTDAEGSAFLLAEELAKKAVHAGSRDNVSVGLVVFRDFWAGPGRTQCVSVTVPPDLPEAAGTSGATEAGEGRQEGAAGGRIRKANRKFFGPDWE